LHNCAFGVLRHALSGEESTSVMSGWMTSTRSTGPSSRRRRQRRRRRHRSARPETSGSRPSSVGGTLAAPGGGPASNARTLSSRAKGGLLLAAPAPVRRHHCWPGEGGQGLPARSRRPPSRRLRRVPAASFSPPSAFSQRS